MFLPRSLRLFPCVLCAVIASACASIGKASLQGRSYTSTSGLYTLELPVEFAERERPNQSYDRFFAWSERDWVVGVVLDQPAVDLAVLDEVVRRNAAASALPTELVRERDAWLGAIPARRTEFVLDVEGERMLLINLHTATSDHNVQLVISGPLVEAEGLRRLSEQLEHSTFRFTAAVSALPVTAPYLLDDETLPVRFASLPPGWTVARRGSLNPEASLELQWLEQDLWFMAHRESLDGEIASELLRDASDDYAAAVHEQLASVLIAVPPGNLAPFDETGGGDDRRFSLGGFFEEGGIPLVYRVRLIRDGVSMTRFTCWGHAARPVAAACDELFDLAELPSSP
ncbi:MAG: hypothetical protein ACO3JL_00080 [Myxococcota bacterium]